MKIHLLSGFLGSGKTTAIQRACKILTEDRIPVGVIANDQGIRLVDGNYFRTLGIPSRQVVNGCFCCHYNELDERIQSLIDAHNPACIFAEAVGSCTDMVATVVKPLLQFRPAAAVTISVFADARLLLMLLEGNTGFFEESISYIYFKQLEEAGLILVSKTDLLTTGQPEKLKTLLNERYPAKLIHFQNTFDDTDLRKWLSLLEASTASPGLPSLEIDYDIYGEGEAMLGWLDQELEISNPYGRAREAAIALAQKLFEKVRQKNYPIGHLKFLLDDHYKISYTAADEIANTTEADFSTAPAVLKAGSAAAVPGTAIAGSGTVIIAPGSAATARLLINARVQTDPASLSGLVAEAIRETADQFGCLIQTNTRAAFQPGYPTPTHRMGAGLQ